MIDTINLLISIGIECLVMIYYTNSTMSPRKTYTAANLGIVLGYCILYIISLYKLPFVNVVAFALVNFVVIFLLFEVKIKNAVIQLAILMAIMILPEGTVALMMNVGIYNDALSDMSLSARIIHGVFSKMIYFIGILIAKYVSDILSKEKSKYGTVEGHLSMLCIPLFSTVTIVGIMAVFRYLNEQQRIMFAMISFFGVVANIVVYWMYDRLLLYHREMERLQEEQYNNRLELTYCNMLEDKLAQTKVLRHDFKEHLKVLAAYIGDNNENALDYLKSIDIKNDEISIVNYTHSKILNILFSEKQKICIEKGIEFKVHATNTELDFIKDIDIVSIFSNLLNNAIESCEKSKQKIIYVNLYKINASFLGIKIDNSCDERPIEDNGFFKTTKTSGSGHGVGLDSVSKTVKKYSGDLRLQYNSDERMFSVMIMIPLKNE